jgi:hypothetical protein
MAHTAADVAQWMLAQVQQKPLYQDQAAWEILRSFGKQFTYDNANGNVAIGKDVLKEFNKFSADNVVWSRGELRDPDRGARCFFGILPE